MSNFPPTLNEVEARVRDLEQRLSAVEIVLANAIRDLEQRLSAVEIVLANAILTHRDHASTGNDLRDSCLVCGAPAGQPCVGEAGPEGTRMTGPRCEVGTDGKVVLVCPADCPCTIERQRAVREIADAVQRYLAAKRDAETGP